MYFIENIDNQVILNLYNFMENHQFLKNLFIFITTLGNSGIIWIIFAIFLYFNKSTKKNGVIMICSLLIGFIIGNLILKNLIARDRPFIQLSLIPLISAPSGFSFPSGHSLSSFIGATSIFMFNKKYGILAYILAFLIAVSRILLAVHYPTDIIAGAILGIFISYFSYKILNKNLKFSK